MPTTIENLIGPLTEAGVSPQNILWICEQQGIINDSTVGRIKEELNKQEILRCKSLPTTGKIQHGKDGRYSVFVREKAGSRRKHLIARTEAELEQKIVDFYSQFKEKPTFGAVFDIWIRWKDEEDGIKAFTLTRYKDDFKRFCVSSGFDKTIVSDLTDIELETYIKRTIRKEKLSAKAYAGLRTIIRGTLIHARKLGLTTFSVVDFFNNLALSKNIFVRRVKSNEEQVFSDDEIEAIIQYIEDREKREPYVVGYAIMLAIETGLREGELAALSWTDLTGNRLWVHRTEVQIPDENGHRTCNISELTKGSEGHRYVVLTERALDILNRLKRIDPFGSFIFMSYNPRSREIERIKAEYITKHLKRICRKLGIPERSSHHLRKTYISKLIAAGLLGPAEITDQVGHVDYRTTEQYYMFSVTKEDQVRRQIETSLKRNVKKKNTDKAV